MAVIRYFVYALFVKGAFLPFYIGKGSGNRLHRHELAARRGDRSVVATKIRELWAAGKELLPIVLVENLTEEGAFRIEEDLIQLVGREPVGPLINLSKGGSWGLTAEAIERRTVKLRGKKKPLGIGAKISAAKMGHSVSAETRAKISAALTGRKQLAEIVAKRGMANSNAQRGKRRGPHSESHRAAISAGLLLAYQLGRPKKGMNGKKHSPETRAKMRATAKRIGKQPPMSDEIRQKMSAAQLKRWAKIPRDQRVFGHPPKAQEE